MKVLLHGAYGGSDRFPDFISRGFVDALGKSNVWLKTASQRIGRREARNTYGLREAALEQMDSFDLIVFSFHSFFDDDFHKMLNHSTSATKVFIDPDDNFFIRRIYLHKEIKYYFKREIYRHIEGSEKLEWSLRYLYGDYRRTGARKALQPLLAPYRVAREGMFKKMLPFPIIYAPEKLKRIGTERRRVYDVSYTMNPQNIRFRGTIRRYMDRLRAEKGDRVLVRSNLGKKEYERVLMESKASISIRGMGYDTYRYWEIPYYGSMLVSQEIPLQIPHNFVDGESAVFFNSAGQLGQKLDRYVFNSDEWRGIAKKGQDLYFRHHTPKKRIEELVLKYVK